MMNDVFIVGVSMTPFGKFPELSVKDLTRNAVTAALHDADLRLEDIDAFWFSNTRQGIMEGQNTIRGQSALRSMGVEGKPVFNIENACASSSTGLIGAVAQIRAGMAEAVLVVGAEKMVYPNQREDALKAFRGGTDIHLLDETWARLLKAGEGIAPDEGAVGADANGDHSFFMDIYASMARVHMKRFGSTQAQMAAAAAKNHFHSTMNPLAQYRNDVSVDEVLADRPITWPLTRSMCAPLSDGASAAIVCSRDFLKRHGGQGRAIRILSQKLVSGTSRAVDDYDRHMSRLAANAAYEAAGLGPDDMDLAEVHDATSFAEILQIENLGFCEPGEGGAISAAGETKLGGRIPVNTSGGLVSKGHPIAATGVAMIFELVTQLRGEAGKRQVEHARHAIAENGGGFWGVEEAATTITILGRA